MDRLVGNAPETRVQFPATAVFFALFGQFIFTHPFLLSSFFASLSYRCTFFASINSFIGGYGSCTEKGIFCSF
jgi:hypothetical protein